MGGFKSETSYPELKYPSLRDIAIKNPDLWMRGKSIDDCTDGLWRIHDKLYDFTSFMKDHPGGEEWLSLTKGTDITEAFESHHFSTIPESLLSKYFIKVAINKRNSPFTFNKDGFYITLKSRIAKELENIPKEKVNKSKVILDTLVLTLFTLSILTCWLKTLWLKIFAYAIAGLVMAWVSNCAHNFVHQKNNWRMYMMNFVLYTTREFRISHVLSHHLYANTLFDFEMSGLEPYFKWLPRKNKNFYDRYCTGGIAIIVYLTAYDFTFISRFLARIMYKTPSPVYTEDLVRLLLPMVMYASSNCGLINVLINWVVIMHFGSFFILLIGLNSAHHHPDIFHDGDAPVKGGDWGLHQLHSVMDRIEVNASLFRALTSFGHHGLHHLFPTLDHSILVHLYPVFLQTCKEFQTELRMTTQFQMFIGNFQQLARIDCKNAEEPLNKKSVNTKH